VLSTTQPRLQIVEQINSFLLTRTAAVRCLDFSCTTEPRLRVRLL